MRTVPTQKIGVCQNRDCRRHGAVACYETSRGLLWLCLVCGVGLSGKEQANGQKRSVET